MKLSEVNIREKKFHNELHSVKGSRKENIFYKAVYNLYEDFYEFLNNNCKDKFVLDFGCGVGSITEQIAKQKPSKIIGADISNISIEKAKKRASEINLDIDYRIENCEKSSFDSNSFDLIYGTGILHHLNLKNAITEINRLLKKNGKMVFVEPLGTNPIINLYRKLTPSSRSKDEHPFIKKDFDYLEKTLGNLDVRYYGFFTLVFFLFYKNPKKSFVYKILAFCDQIIFKVKYLRFLAWSVLIVGTKN